MSTTHTAKSLDGFEVGQLLATRPRPKAPAWWKWPLIVPVIRWRRSVEHWGKNYVFTVASVDTCSFSLSDPEP